MSRDSTPVPMGGREIQRLVGANDGRPKGLLFRQIATPNYELRSFLHMCRRLGFDPVVLTWNHDHMSCQNVYKRALVAPMFIEGINRRGQWIWRQRPMINIESVENIPFSDVQVGEWSLPDLHRELLHLTLPDKKFALIDCSDWLLNYPGGPHDYYVDIFLALTGGVVLFETFVSNSKEAAFFRNVVQPAFRQAEAILGHRPNVIPLCQNWRGKSPLWYGYPDGWRHHFTTLGVLP